MTFKFPSSPASCILHPVSLIHFALYALRFTLLLILLILAAAGCAPKKAPPVETAIPLTKDLLERMDRQDARGKTLKGLARVTLRSPEGVFSTTCAVVARFPSYLRLETIPLIGPPDLFLTVNGDLLKAFLPAKGKFYVGRSTKETLSRFIPLPLDIHTIIPLLMGIPPSLDLKREATLRVVRDADVYRMDVLSGGGRRLRSLWLNPSSNELTQFESFESDGTIAYKVMLEDYRSVGGTTMPERIDIRIGGEERDATSLRILYSDLQLSTGEDDGSLFDLDVPPGIKPMLLE